MTEESGNTKTTMLSLGRLNIRTRKDKNGKEETYYTGSIMIKNAGKNTTPLKSAKTFTDKFGNVKIGVVVFKNDYKDKETDADFRIYESTPQEKKPETDDIPF